MNINMNIRTKKEEIKMGTSNFYNHENGIFVLKTPDYDEILKMEVERLLEDEYLFDTDLVMEEFNDLSDKEKESILSSGEDILVQMAKREIDDETIYQEMGFYEEMEVNDIFEDGMGLNYQLELEGLDLIKDKDDWNRARVYSRTGKLLAELILESGYYDGVQIIVETDPYELLEHDYDLFYNDRIEDYQDEFVKSKLNEVYSVHNKTLFKVISKYTTPIVRVGGFSDGTSVYQLA